MTATRMLLAVLVALVLAGGSARAAEAGKVVRLQGSAQAVDAGHTRTLSPGDPVNAGDSLRTGPGSRLLVLFSDGMELTLSDGAEMAVTAFRWQGGQGNAELALAQGAFLLRTGAVGKLPDHPLTVKTPLASVGVRGTQFWGGPLDAPLSVLLFEGRVVVTSAKGSVELGTPGEGTSIAGPDASPRTPSFWGDQKIRAAFDTVTFTN